MPRKNFPVNVVGPQIRKVRYQLGLSQSQMAARCQMAGFDISRSTLGQIEICFRYVSDEELLVLASVLKVALEDLYPQDWRRHLRNKLLKRKRH